MGGSQKNEGSDTDRDRSGGKSCYCCDWYLCMNLLALQTPLKLLIIHFQGIVLPCSLDDFFKQFLTNDAPFSLYRFQRDCIHDHNIELSGWTIESDGALHRTLSFAHPIKNAVAFGPTSAQTSRQQKLRKYDSFGMILENTTRVQGIPSADAFCIQDFWLIEAMPDGKSIRIMTWFDTLFHKRSLIKGLIQKSIRGETKEWLVKYHKFMLDALGTAPPLTVTTAPISAPPSMPLAPVATSKVDLDFYWRAEKYAQVVVLLLLLILLLLMIQVRNSYHTVQLLKKNADLLIRLDTGASCPSQV
jgi:VAD1 Analog of StAR-related lipid transfer domain